MRLALLFTIGSLLFTFSVLADDVCTLSTDPCIIYQVPHQLLQVWTVNDAPELWSQRLPSTPSFVRFRSEVANKIRDLDPVSILKNEYQDFMRSGDPVYTDEAKKMPPIISKQVGTIRPINCLEALLLTVQLERQSMTENPSEFGAFILKNKEVGHPMLKIYFSTWDIPGGKADQRLMSLVDSDLANGWTLSRHLHNHNFFFQNPISVMGGTCPSTPDIKLYRNLEETRGLNSAAVTNGFNTIDLRSDEFRKLDL